MPAPESFETFERFEFARRRLIERIQQSASLTKRDAIVEDLASGASHAWCLWVTPQPERPALLVCGEWTLSAFVLQGFHSRVDVWEADEVRASLIASVAHDAGLPIDVRYCPPATWRQRLASAQGIYGLAAMQQSIGLIKGRTPRRDMLAALAVAATPGGQCCVVSRNRYARAADGDALDGDRPGATPTEVRRAWARHAGRRIATLLLHPDHHGLTEILFPPEVLPKARRNQWLPRVLARSGVIEHVLGSFACISSASDDSSLVEAAAGQAGPDRLRCAESAPVIDCTIRDSSMMFVTLALAAGGHAIARVPLQRESVDELRRLDAAYGEVARTVPQLGHLLPPSARLQSIHGWPVHIERKFTGTPVRLLLGNPEVRAGARRQILDVVNELCRATLERQVVDAAFDETHFGTRVRSLCQTEPACADDLMRLRSATLGRLAGSMLPTVRIHGDLTINNVLVDPASRAISGIIDWETSLAGSLPFDLIHYLISELRDRDPQPWGVQVARAVTGRLFDAEAESMLLAHLGSLGMTAEQRTPLLIAYWIRGVALRQTLSGGRLTPAWRDQNLVAPLASMVQAPGTAR